MRPPVYSSLFIKADYRAEMAAAGGSRRRTTLGEWASLDDTLLDPGARWHPDLPDGRGPRLALPLVGGALLTTATEAEVPLAPGYLYRLPPGPLALRNPFAEPANLLLLQAPGLPAAPAAVREMALPLTERNVLVAPVPAALPAQVGLFDSRTKGALAGGAGPGRTLCYVLNGAFEIADRLVGQRDALLLWDTPEIEFEALTEVAMLFCLHLAES